MRWLVLIFALFHATEVFARAGGGGGGGGGHGGGGGGSLGLNLVVLLGALLYYWYVRARIRRRVEEVTSLLRQTAGNERDWDRHRLLATSTRIFFEIQKAWSEQDFAVLERHLHSPILAEWTEQIEALKAKGHRNILDDLEIVSEEVVAYANFAEDSRDNFTVLFKARVTDYEMDRHGNRVSTRDDGKIVRGELFEEFWTFRRMMDGGWGLEKIRQDSEWNEVVSSPVIDESGKGKAA